MPNLENHPNLKNIKTIFGARLILKIPKYPRKSFVNLKIEMFVLFFFTLISANNFTSILFTEIYQNSNKYHEILSIKNKKSLTCA